jgi:hypothetical protein
VLAILKDVFLPWYNAYRFLLQNVDSYEREEKTVFSWNEVRKLPLPLYCENMFCTSSETFGI